MNHNENKSVRNATLSSPGLKPSRVGEVLTMAPLTEFCAQSTRERLERSGRIEHHSHLTSLHRAGDVVTDLTLIVNGSLGVSKVSAAGRRHVIAFLAPGQFFGLVALLDGKGGIHDTWAQGELTVLRVSKATVMHSLSCDPAFREAVLGLLCERSRATYGALMDHTLLSLRARTARTIHSLALTWGISRGERVMIELKISQDGLADMLGVTRQSTNRELKLLEREGLIRLGNSEIELLNVPGLCRIAEGND